MTLTTMPRAHTSQFVDLFEFISESSSYVNILEMFLMHLKKKRHEDALNRVMIDNPSVIISEFNHRALNWNGLLPFFTLYNF